MTTVTREQISVAFFDLIKGAANFTATSRRFVHWDQVNETQMPFLTMLKTGEVRARQSEGLPSLTINAHVFIYMSAGMDPEDVPVVVVVSPPVVATSSAAVSCGVVVSVPPPLPLALEAQLEVVIVLSSRVTAAVCASSLP